MPDTPPKSRLRPRPVLLTLLAAVLIAGVAYVASFDLKTRVEAGLSEVLSAQVRIRDLRWRGLSAWTAEGIRVEQDGARMASLDRLHLVGSPWALLRQRVVLDTLEIAAPSLHLRRDAKGRWNLSALNAATDTSSGEGRHPLQRIDNPLRWSLEVRHGTLRAGSLSIATGAARVGIDSLNLDFGVRPDGEGHALLLSRLNSALLSPPLLIRRVDAAAVLQEDSLDLTTLDLETEASRLRLRGHIRNFSDPRVDLVLNADRLSPEEIRRFFPTFPLTGPLDLTASLKGGRDGLDVVSELRTQGGSLEGRGRLHLAATPVAYDLTLKTRGLDLARLLPGRTTSTDLNLSLSASGKGLSASDADLSASLVTASSSVGGAAFEASEARLRLRDGILDAEARLRIEGWGDLRGEGRLDLRAAPLRYRIDADVADLNLAPLTGDPSWQSSLSGRVEVSGSGLALDGLDLEGRALLRPSRIAGRRIDGLEAGGRYRGRALTLDRLALRAPAGRGQATGQVLFPPDRPLTYGGEVEVSGLDLAAVTGDTTLRSDLNATVAVAGEGMDEMSLRAEGHPSRFLDIPIHRFTAGGGVRQGAWRVEKLQMESAAGDVTLTGTVGPSDSLDIRADLSVRHLLLPVRGLSLALSGGASGTLKGRLADLRVAATGHADSLDSGAVALRDAAFDLSLRGLDLRRPGAGVDTTVSGDITVRVGRLAVSSFALNDLIAGAHLTPGVADLALNVAPEDWALLDTAGRIAFAPGGFVARLDTLSVDARKLRVRSEGHGRLRYAYGGAVRLESLRMVQEGGALTASGEVDEKGRIQGEFRLDGVDLRRWEDLLGRRDGLAGVLSVTATASGRLKDPEVSGSVQIADGKVADFAYRRLAGTFDYRKGVGQVDLRLDQGEASSPKGLTLRGSAALSSDGALDLRVLTDGLDLAFLQTAFPDLRDVEGSLRGDLTLTGTARRPALSGFLEVPSGRLRVPRIGLRLTDARLRLDASPGRLTLSGLTLRTRGGSLEGRGEMRLDGLRVKDFDALVKADDFDALDRKEAQLNVSGDLRLTGTPTRPDLTWDLTVQRALLPIPEEEGPAQASPSIYDSEFVRGMTCKGRLRVPRNAWVRSSDFNAEVQGEIEVVKEGPVFILFGGLEAIRGQYIFQNARFSIARGELRFRGTPDEDPDLYLVGVRRLPRVLPDASGSPGQDLTISIVVGGTLNKPQVSLESDAPTPLDQADLLSYALFGQPSSQTLLGSLGNGGSAADFQAQAQNLAVGIAANRLKQTVGRELGLDVLEVEMGQGKETLTHLAVGKYVSRDLLLTFSQDLIEGQGQDRLGRKVSVEYEFSRSFGLSGSVDDQKKTALDLFWKKEW